MRTLCLNFEVDAVAIACGAPGHVMSAVFAANPLDLVLTRLAQLFGAYEPAEVLMNGERGEVSAAIEEWLASRGHPFSRLPENAIDEIANGLAMGALDLSIVEGPALFENCRPGEDRALAALELNHRLMQGSAELHGQGVCL